MKLAEFLIQGQHLRQQDRTLAIAYFEQCLQNTNTGENVEEDPSTAIRVLLDLAVELIATKQSESLQRAQALVQQAGEALNQNPDHDHEQKAYLLYVRAILALELWELGDVLHVLEMAYETYSNSSNISSCNHLMVTSTHNV